MSNLVAIREKPKQSRFKKNDVLVLVGELFNRGYGNGLVEEALKNGIKIIRATVGRRDENLNLRALSVEELNELMCIKSFGDSPLINIPLEAGFDLEKDLNNQAPIDYLKGFKLSEWQNAMVPDKTLQESKMAARLRFRKNLSAFINELDRYISPDSHVHFAHLMAGGVPRTKIVMPLLNRVFKGTGDRYLSSSIFWESPIGKFMEMNFLEVTAQTFDELISLSSDFRASLEKTGGSVSYVAYGYHGTEVVFNDELSWQSYAPYIQGWAKIELENISKKWFEKGVRSCVYNCPEILTNSSSIFQGVEIALYNLLRSLKKIAPDHPVTTKMLVACQATLKDQNALSKIFSLVDQYMNFSESLGTSDFATWPQHSQQLQLERLLETSDAIIDLHIDKKALMTGPLSEIIFKACGNIMLHDGFQPRQPVAWIGHDVVCKILD